MILDSIINSSLLLTNACFKVLQSIQEMPKNMTKIIHETQKFSP